MTNQVLGLKVRVIIKANPHPNSNPFYKALKSPRSSGFKPTQNLGPPLRGLLKVSTIYICTVWLANCLCRPIFPSVQMDKVEIMLFSVPD